MQEMKIEGNETNFSVKICPCVAFLAGSGASERNTRYYRGVVSTYSHYLSPVCGSREK